MKPLLNISIWVFALTALIATLVCFFLMIETNHVYFWGTIGVIVGVVNLVLMWFRTTSWVDYFDK